MLYFISFFFSFLLTGIKVEIVTSSQKQAIKFVQYEGEFAFYCPVPEQGIGLSSRKTKQSGFFVLW
jgi:hypothetical protein